jgi:hypothetical protein
MVYFQSQKNAVFPLNLTGSHIKIAPFGANAFKRIPKHTQIG